MPGEDSIILQVPPARLEKRHGHGRSRGFENRRRGKRFFCRYSPRQFQASNVEKTTRTSRPKRVRVPGSKTIRNAHRSPNVAMITPGTRASATTRSTNALDVTHTGHPGPETSRTESGRSSLIPTGDGHGMRAAYLHQRRRTSPRPAMARPGSRRPHFSANNGGIKNQLGAFEKLQRFFRVFFIKAWMANRRE